MISLNAILPFGSAVISIAFAALVFGRYLRRRGPHLLLWGIGMVFYAIGGLCEGLYGAFGWNDAVFRAWYLFGAVLVAAWLGQGTVYLLLRRWQAHVLMVLLALGSLYAAFAVAGAALDPAQMAAALHTGSELSGSAIKSGGVRVLTPFFNTYGTLALVGGAAWSAWVFWRKRVLLHRTIGNVLIAAGALLPAFGGVFSRFGVPDALYASEFVGAILLFAGFVRATTPMCGPQESPVKPVDPSSEPPEPQLAAGGR